MSAMSRPEPLNKWIAGIEPLTQGECAEAQAQAKLYVTQLEAGHRIELGEVEVKHDDEGGLVVNNVDSMPLLYPAPWRDESCALLGTTPGRYIATLVLKPVEVDGE